MKTKLLLPKNIDKHVEKLASRIKKTKEGILEALNYSPTTRFKIRISSHEKIYIYPSIITIKLEEFIDFLLYSHILSTVLPVTEEIRHEYFRVVNEKDETELLGERIDITEVSSEVRKAMEEFLHATSIENTSQTQQALVALHSYEVMRRQRKQGKKRKKRKENAYFTRPELAAFMVEATQSLVTENQWVFVDPAMGVNSFMLSSMLVEPEKKNDVNKKRKDIGVGVELHRVTFLLAVLVTIVFLRVGFQRYARFYFFRGNALSNNIRGHLQRIIDSFHKAHLVIIGNPPFGMTKKLPRTFKEYLQSLSLPYERKRTWLGGDYFLLLAYSLMKTRTKGFVFFILNNSFLYSTTRKDLRHLLLQEFHEVFILDLKGDKQRFEPDENVFRIKLGVSICGFRKRDDASCLKDKKARVHYFSLVNEEKRKAHEKIHYLVEHSFSSIKWKSVNAEKPYYLLVPHSLPSKVQERALPLPQLFNSYGTGVKTDRDSWFISFTLEELTRSIMQLFEEVREQNTRQVYSLDSSSYALSKKLEQKRKELRRKTAGNDLAKSIKQDIEEHARIIHYRPFDFRFIYYEPKVLSRPNQKIFRHVIDCPLNYVLIVTRQAVEDPFSHVLITSELAESRVVMSGQGTAYAFPLFNMKSMGKACKSNINVQVLTILESQYHRTISPQDVFFYVYGVLLSKWFSEKFSWLLKLDFPRIPFPERWELFFKVMEYARGISELQLTLPKPPRTHLNGTDKSWKVKEIRYEKSTETVWINDSREIRNVPETVWKFRIGRIRVVKNWLLQRQGRILTIYEQEYFSELLYVLKELLRVREKIDQVLELIDEEKLIPFSRLLREGRARIS